MKRENHWMMRLFILLFSISMSIAIVPCGVVNVYGALGEVYSSVTIEAEKEPHIVKEEFSKVRKEKGINVYNVWFILCVIVSYISFMKYSIRLPRGDTIVELQVNARNSAAYEMYKKYGFTEKSINMELLD